MKKLGIDINKIIELHKQGKSPLQISKELNCSIANISKRLKKLEIKSNRTPCNYDRVNRYKLNIDFFKNIDCEEKAYILGLLYADGSVSKDGFYLKMKDEEILLKVKHALEAEQEVKYINRKGYYAYLLSISSQQISLDLQKQGCLINKTYCLQFPILDNNLLSHFIRGYFDGDGCLFIHDNINSCKLSFISASEDFLKSLRIIISNISGKSGSLIPQKKGKPTMTLSFTGRQINCILDWLYQNATIFLERKYNKFLIYKNVHLKLGELSEKS